MGIRTMGGVLAVAMLAAGFGLGQTPVAGPAAKKVYTAFDVASIKENKATDRGSMSFPLGSSDAYTPSGGHFKATDFPLSVYINFAYKIPASQGAELAQQLPAWAKDTRYDIEAKVEGEPGKDDMRAMMRALLAQRFGLKVHSALREEPVLDLVLAKPGATGTKLRAYPDGDPRCAKDAEPDTSEKTPPPRDTRDDFPGVCGVIVGMDAGAGQIKIGARNIPITAFASVIPGIGNLGRTVVDKTGLHGRYDFTLEFTPDAHTFAPGTEFTPDAAGPSVLNALMEQMGLKVVPDRGQVETFVLDHIDHLTEN